MVDIDLSDIQILTSHDVDLTQVAHIKKVESQNNYLKYGLVFSLVISLSFLSYHIYNKSKETKPKG